MATCIITNCRGHAPATEPFCAKHRDSPKATRPSAPPSTVGEDATAGEFVMVPREPTEAMIRAATPWMAASDLQAVRCEEIWSAMIAAAPKATQPIGLDEREKIARIVADRMMLTDEEMIDAILALSATPVDVGEVVEVLAPFTALTEQAERHDWLDDAGFTLMHHHKYVGCVLLSDLRRARALHDRLTGMDR